MRLPCRHVFSLRAKDGISLYDSSLCDPRWTASYYRSTQTFSQTEPEILEENIVSVDVLPGKPTKKMNSHQKFSTALNAFKKMANTCQC